MEPHFIILSDHSVERWAKTTLGFNLTVSILYLNSYLSFYLLLIDCELLGLLLSKGEVPANHFSASNIKRQELPLDHEESVLRRDLSSPSTMCLFQRTDYVLGPVALILWLPPHLMIESRFVHKSFIWTLSGSNTPLISLSTFTQTSLIYKMFFLVTLIVQKQPKGHYSDKNVALQAVFFLFNFLFLLLTQIWFLHLPRTSCQKANGKKGPNCKETKWVNKMQYVVKQVGNNLLLPR